MSTDDLLLSAPDASRDTFTCTARASLVANILKIFIGSGVLFLPKALCVVRAPRRRRRR